MTTTATSLYDLAAELLTQTQAALATTPAGSPSRAYVSIGDPPFDCCDQLTVQTAVDQADAGVSNKLDVQRRLQYGSVNLVALKVTIIRCHPVASAQQDQVAFPSVSVLTTVAQSSYQDAWVTWNYLQKKHRDNALFAGFPCRPVSISALTPITPEGGCAGWTLQVLVELDGYPAT